MIIFISIFLLKFIYYYLYDYINFNHGLADFKVFTSEVGCGAIGTNHNYVDGGTIIFCTKCKDQEVKKIVQVLY